MSSTMSPRLWVRGNAERVQADYRPDGRTRGHTFDVSGKEVTAGKYAEHLVRTVKELKGANPRSIAAEIGVLLRMNGAPPIQRRRKKHDPEILRTPQVFTVEVPGGGSVLVSTRDTKTRLLFEVEVTP